MKKLAAAALSAFLLAGCGAQAPAPQLAPIAASSGAEARMFETFKAHLVQKKDNDGYWSLGFTARSLTGKTYKDEHLLGFVDGGYNAGVSDVLLGQDGNLYVNAEFQVALDRDRQESKEVKGWFKVGTYKKPAAMKAGEPVSFKFAGGSKCKMNWQGLNPMGENFMMFYLGKKAATQPQAQAPDLLK